MHPENPRNGMGKKPREGPASGHMLPPGNPEFREPVVSNGMCTLKTSMETESYWTGKRQMRTGMGKGGGNHHFNDVTIHAGHVIAVTPLNRPGFRKSRYAGMTKFEYIINHLAVVPGLRERFQTGAAIATRYLVSGCVYPFNSKITDITAKKNLLLFASYLSKVQKHDLRSFERISTFIKAGAERDGNMLPGTIVDLSAGVCIFVMDGSQPEIVEHESGSKLELTFQLPGIPGILNMPAEVMNVKRQNGQTHLGLRFFPFPKDGREPIKAPIADVMALRGVAS